jgi:hypothetical protein
VLEGDVAELEQLMALAVIDGVQGRVWRGRYECLGEVVSCSNGDVGRGVVWCGTMTVVGNHSSVSAIRLEVVAHAQTL